MLVFGALRKCDLVGCSSEKRESMPLLYVVHPYQSIFCCANCQLWFYNRLRSSTEIKAFLIFF